MSALHWFEIPVSDIQRAVKFYETVMGVQIPVMDLRATMGSMIGMLPGRGGAGGALVQNAQHGYVPGQAGALVYLVVDGELGAVAGRAEAAGGIVWISDTEGNRVGLFSTT
jgi:uncharacterized protein